MDALRLFAQGWFDVFVLHMGEVSVFLLLIWAVDRVCTLDVSLRYGLWLLGLVKLFVPPFLSVPAPWVIEQPSRPIVSGTVSLEPLLMEAGRVEPVSWLTPAVCCLFLWGTSVLVFAGVTVWKNVSVRRRLAGSVPVRLPHEFLGLFPELRRVRCFENGSLQSPVLYGFRRVGLYVPTDWRTWPEAHLKGVLAHEAAHLRGRDPWTLGAQTLAMILFGFHPLVWLMHRRLIHLRELRCDEAVVGRMEVSALEYSKMLYSFAQRQVAGPFAEFSGMYFTENGRSVRERFEHVLSLKEGHMNLRKWRHIGVLIAVALVMAPLSVLELRSAEFAEQAMEFWNVDVKPELIRPASPVYPEEARKAGLEGAVFAKFRVGTDGKVHEVQVLKGADVFRQAAIDAILKFEFKPAQHEGKPVSVWMTQPIRFNLDGQMREEVVKAANPVKVYVNKKGEIMIDLIKQVGIADLKAEVKHMLQQPGRDQTVLLRHDGNISGGLLIELFKLKGERSIAGNSLRDVVLELSQVSAPIVFDPPIKGMEERSETSPDGFALQANFPNPFNPETIIPYEIGAKVFVKLEVFGISGQRVRTLVSEVKAAGKYQVKWGGEDDRGVQVSSGIYFVKMEAGDYSNVKRMQLLK